MRIAVLSDFHFGFAPHPELENDCFDNANEAIEKALNTDLILLAGDIFDSRVPKTNVWAKAIQILVKPLLKNSTVHYVSCTKDLKEISQRTLSHLPVIAIHGTHERKGKDDLNVIEALENAGILIHLHCQTIIFEKNGVKVAIHGMSGVPERYAKDILYQWNPQPIKDCFNILLLHQSIEPYVYSPLERPSLNLSNLPKNFDLIIDGHVHTSFYDKIGKTPILFPGSTITTQFELKEAQTEKGFFEIEIDSNKNVNVKFIPLQQNRKFIYDEILIQKNLPFKEQIELKINQILEKIKSPKPPIVKIKIVAKEIEIQDQDLRTIEKKYSDKAILIFTKELESPEITQKVEFLKNLRDQKLSLEEIGLQLLRKNLENLNCDPKLDYESIFMHLANGEIERAFALLTEQVKG